MTPFERDELVHRHMPIVRHIAKRVARVVRAADVGDLVGDGCVGLLRAVDSYDPSRGPSFESYARRVVLGAMLNGMRRADPVSERVRRTIRAADRERYAAANVAGRLASFSDMERSDPALRRARASAHRHKALSLDVPLGVGTTARADARSEPAEVVQRCASRREIAEAIALLPLREQRIIAMHYAGEASLQTIGRELSVSAQRVSQLHQRAIQKLRATLPADSDYR